MKMIPIAIPKAQSIPIAESSLIFCLPDRYSTPSADSIPKTAAPMTGLIPAKYPIPIPPNEAWVIPPLRNTILLDTIYVPARPAVMLANKAPRIALTIKSY